MAPETFTGGPQDRFPPTAWSDILAARDRSSPECQEKLNALFLRYWKPVYRCIRVAWHKNIEDAKDLTQEFFATLLQREFVERLDPKKGRFRSVLLAALKNFMLNEKRDTARAKRGGGLPPLPLDEIDETELPPQQDSGSPDEVLDREWAALLFEEAVASARKRLAESGKEQYFQIFAEYYLNSDDEPTYEALAQKFRISVTDVTNHLARVRALVRGFLLDRIREYALGEADAENELRTLFRL